MDLSWAGEIAELLNRFLDGELSGDDALRALAAIGGSLLLGIAVGRWRSIAMRLPVLRGLIDPYAAFASLYIEIFENDDVAHYAIFRIYYRYKYKHYAAEGIAYNVDQSHHGTFKSNFVRFPTEERPTIEFVWSSHSSGAHQLTGHTIIDIDEIDSGKPIEGSGAVIGFQNLDKRPFRLYELTRKSARRLAGQPPPRTESQRQAFMTALRAKRTQDGAPSQPAQSS